MLTRRAPPSTPASRSTTAWSSSGRHHQRLPALAERWEIAADGKSFTFHLRKGVKFQSNKNFKPTRDFNADDVLFSFERQWKDANPYHKVSGGGYDYFNDMGINKLLSSIEKVDDYTVRFTLTAPKAPFLADLAMDFATIQSEEYADALLKEGTPELIDQEPIGTGPFEFVAVPEGCDHPLQGVPRLLGTEAEDRRPGLLDHHGPDGALAKLRANECQVMAFPNPADLAAIKADPALQLHAAAGPQHRLLAFNDQKPPFATSGCGRAINMAIDKEAILKAVYQGAGQPAKNLDPADHVVLQRPGPGLPVRSREGEGAAGEGRLPQRLRDRPLVHAGAAAVQSRTRKRMAELMQADLAKVGVKAKLVTYEWGEYRKRCRPASTRSA